MARRRTHISSDYTLIPVPKNILLAAPDFDFFEWSVIFDILVILKPFMSIDSREVIYKELPDEITLNYKDISAKNIKREKLYERLLILRSKEIRYRIKIPGNQLEVTTGLFSSVIKEEKGGCVYVKIQKEAIPWLLALGQGYSPVEKNVFDSCYTDYIRRAYLFICSKMIRGNASFTATVSDWRKVLNCPDTDKPSKIIGSYISELKTIIEDTQTESHYMFDFKPVYSKTVHGAGRKGISGITVTMLLKSEYTDEKQYYGKVLRIMQKYYSVVPRTNLHNIADVVNKIIESPVTAEQFIQADREYTIRYSNDDVHVANTVFLVLRDQLRIDVRNKGANREVKAAKKAQMKK